MQFMSVSPAMDQEDISMTDWKARNQRNKAVVWEYWQRMNHAQAKEVPGIVKKAFRWQLFQNTHFSFLDYAKRAFIFSWILVTIGVVSFILHRDQAFGIDFTGGDEVTIHYDQRLTSEQPRETVWMAMTGCTYARLMRSSTSVTSIVISCCMTGLTNAAARAVCIVTA